MMDRMPLPAGLIPYNLLSHLIRLLVRGVGQRFAPMARRGQRCRRRAALAKPSGVQTTPDDADPSPAVPSAIYPAYTTGFVGNGAIRARILASYLPARNNLQRVFMEEILGARRSHSGEKRRSPSTTTESPSTSSSKFPRGRGIVYKTSCRSHPWRLDDRVSQSTRARARASGFRFEARKTHLSPLPTRKHARSERAD